MGLKPQLLPDSFLRRIKRSDRAPMGKAGATCAEGQAKADQRAEKELQRDMENLLRQRGLWFIRSRMDRKTTTRQGVPDFLIVLPGGRALAVEAKVAGGVLSPAQRAEHSQYFNLTHTDVAVVLNLQDFRALLDAQAQ